MDELNHRAFRDDDGRESIAECAFDGGDKAFGVEQAANIGFGEVGGVGHGMST